MQSLKKEVFAYLSYANKTEGFNKLFKRTVKSLKANGSNINGPKVAALMIASM